MTDYFEVIGQLSYEYVEEKRRMSFLFESQS